jgi:hypothetical protein
MPTLARRKLDQSNQSLARRVCVASGCGCGSYASSVCFSAGRHRCSAGQFRLGRGCGGGAPASNRLAPQAPHIRSGGQAYPRRGRVHSQEGAADTARGGIGCKPVSPRSGAPKARLAAKEETRQAAQALLASVNAAGCTRSDPPDVVKQPKGRSLEPISCGEGVRGRGVRCIQPCNLYPQSSCCR